MRHISLLVVLLVGFISLSGCDTFQRRLKEPSEPTATLVPFSTATPGGWISVWLVVPTDQAALPTPSPEPFTGGEVVGPPATATAAIQRILDATATAAAPTPQPTFQPNECPETRGFSPPSQPESFNDFPAAVGVYLSNGGAPSVLESTLRSWGAITDKGGVVQADTDLTGDKIPEIIVTLFNPFTYNSDAILNSGQLLIYGCDNNAYRLLYTTSNNPGIALPVLHRVGDLNGDVKAEVVFDIQSCTTTSCIREGFILSWNTVVGAFETLNAAQILAINGRLGVADFDSDGILEVSVSSNPPPSTTSGPTRGIVDVWDWTGQNYVLAVRTNGDPRYRIHQLQDADAELENGNFRSALRGYFEVRDNSDLLAWTLLNETEMLRAFAAYRILTVYARLGDGRAEEILATLLSENPEGSPAAVYAVMGQSFMDALRSGGSVSGACQAALAAASARPEALSFLNSYGIANRSYSLNDLCPF